MPKLAQAPQSVDACPPTRRQRSSGTLGGRRQDTTLRDMVAVRSPYGGTLGPRAAPAPPVRPGRRASATSRSEHQIQSAPSQAGVLSRTLILTLRPHTHTLTSRPWGLRSWTWWGGGWGEKESRKESEARMLLVISYYYRYWAAVAASIKQQVAKTSAVPSRRVGPNSDDEAAQAEVGTEHQRAVSPSWARL